MTQQAPEAPGLKSMSAIPARHQRPGWAIFVPGSCLKVDSRLWTEQQREQGVWVKGIFLSASEEEDAISEAQREGKPNLIGVYTIRRTLVAIADSLETADPETGEKRLAPGAWRPIPALDLRAYWEELGTQGRGLFTQSFQLANTPSDAARAVALASFRTSA